MAVGDRTDYTHQKRAALEVHATLHLDEKDACTCRYKWTQACGRAGDARLWTGGRSGGRRRRNAVTTAAQPEKSAPRKLSLDYLSAAEVECAFCSELGRRRSYRLVTASALQVSLSITFWLHVKRRAAASSRGEARTVI